MMKLAWATDVHLDMANKIRRKAFYNDVIGTGCDALVITGDIGHGSSFEEQLQHLSNQIERPIYFVLGNHDFYMPSRVGTVAELRQRAVDLRNTDDNLCYLSNGMIVELSPTSALVGHDGWLDGREGSWQTSKVWLNDYAYITDYARCQKRDDFLQVAQRLAGEAADYIQAILVQAFEKYDRVVCATHVPPFKEAAWYDGKPSDEDWLPHFSSRVMGDAVRAVMIARPEKKLLVLCGHTHGRGAVDILDNLRVWTGCATYGYPEVQFVFDPSDVRPVL
jgi:Icc-related predicted phosphoesterase